MSKISSHQCMRSNRINLTMGLIESMNIGERSTSSDRFGIYFFCSSKIQHLAYFSVYWFIALCFKTEKYMRMLLNCIFIYFEKDIALYWKHTLTKGFRFFSSSTCALICSNFFDNVIVLKNTILSNTSMISVHSCSVYFFQQIIGLKPL